MFPLENFASRDPHAFLQSKPSSIHSLMFRNMEPRRRASLPAVSTDSTLICNTIPHGFYVDTSRLVRPALEHELLPDDVSRQITLSVLRQNENSRLQRAAFGQEPAQLSRARSVGRPLKATHNISIHRCVREYPARFRSPVYLSGVPADTSPEGLRLIYEQKRESDRDLSLQSSDWPSTFKIYRVRLFHSC